MSTVILHIDEQPELPEGVADALAREGYALVHTADPEQAIGLVEEHSPALVISEIVFSGCDGPDLIAGIRDPQRGDIPVLVVTTAPRNSQMHGEAIVMGVRDFLTKPALSSEMLEAIRAVAPPPWPSSQPQPERSRPRPDSAGNLAGKALPELLARLHRRGATGTLTVRREKRRMGVQLRNGTVVAIASKRRHMPRADLDALSEQSVADAIAHRAEAELFEAFAWTDGAYRFDERARIKSNAVLEIRRDTECLLLLGILEATPIHYAREWLSKHATLYGICAEESSGISELLGLTPPQEEALAELGGEDTLGDLLQSQLFEERMLYGLCVAGRIDLQTEPLLTLIDEYSNDEILLEHVTPHESEDVLELDQEVNPDDRVDVLELHENLTGGYQEPETEEEYDDDFEYEVPETEEEYEDGDEAEHEEPEAEEEYEDEDESEFEEPEAEEEYEDEDESEFEEPEAEEEYEDEDESEFEEPEAEEEYEDEDESEFEEPEAEEEYEDEDESEFEEPEAAEGYEDEDESEFEEPEAEEEYEDEGEEEPAEAPLEELPLAASEPDDEGPVSNVRAKGIIDRVRISRPAVTQHRRGEIAVIKSVAAPAMGPSAIRASLRALAGRMEGDDFAVLDIPSTATDNEVRKAYEKARDAVPSLGPAATEELRELDTRIRARLAAAYEHLKDSETRSAHVELREEKKQDEAELSHAGRAIGAEKWFRDGEQLLTAKKYEKAGEAFGMATHLDPDEGDYLSHLGYAMFLANPTDTVVQREAMEQIARGIKASPDRELSYVYLGRILQQQGEITTARKVFKRALQIRPDCHAANQALRLLEMRESKGKGLLSRLKRR